MRGKILLNFFAEGTALATFRLDYEDDSFSSPEAAIHLASAMDLDLWPAPMCFPQFSVGDSRTSDLSAQSRTFIKMVDQAINFGQEIQNFSDIT